MGFVNRVVSFFPALKSELRIAHLPYTPIQYVNKNLKETALYAFISTILFFFVLQKAKLPFLLLAPIFIILFILIFEYSLLRIKAKIRQREREINKEVTFVGRYLLVKLYSGRPLLNALIETASSRGVASKYIKEVVDDIEQHEDEEPLRRGLLLVPGSQVPSGEERQTQWPALPYFHTISPIGASPSCPQFRQ
jgi:pilus assembly protein TadC